MTEKDEKLCRLAAFAAAALPVRTSTSPIAAPLSPLSRKEESLPSIGKRKRQEDASITRGTSAPMCNLQPTPSSSHYNEPHDGKEVVQLSPSLQALASLQDQTFLPPREKKAREPKTIKFESETAVSPHYRELTPIQEELAILAEEGVYLMKRNDNSYKDSNKMKTRADWTYIEAHASPALRSIIERKRKDCKNHRNFYMYMNLQYSKGLKESFEQKRAEVRASLRAGRRLSPRCKKYMKLSSKSNHVQQGESTSTDTSTKVSDHNDYPGVYWKKTYDDRVPSLIEGEDKNNDNVVTTEAAPKPEVITISDDDDDRLLNRAYFFPKDRQMPLEENDDDGHFAYKTELNTGQNKANKNQQDTNDDASNYSGAHHPALQRQNINSTNKNVSQGKEAVLSELELILKKVRHERVEQERRNKLMLSWMSNVESHVVQLIESARGITNKDKS